MDAIDQVAEASLATAATGPDFQYERPEWWLFRSVNTLPQKAGVPAGRLRRLVLKELADNALDTGSTVRVGRIGDSNDWFFVEDDGPGIDPDRVAVLFSINRGLISSKLWRLPSRGAMGNGLRVVAGAVAASGGDLVVTTRGRRIVLQPQEDGSTLATFTPVEAKPGTRVAIRFGEALPPDGDALAWARSAARMAAGSFYNGKSSPWWYDADDFVDVLKAGGSRLVRLLIADLDGCSGAKAGQIASRFKGRTCASLTRGEAVELLLAARALARPVRPERLIVNGDDSPLPGAYDCRRGVARIGSRAPFAEMPYTVEAWAEPVNGSDADRSRDVDVLVNRTPVTGRMWTWASSGKRTLSGCGISHSGSFPAGGWRLILNVTIPRCPITTDGKEPDLSLFVDDIFEAARRAARKAKRESPKVAASDEKVTAKSVVLANIDAAVEKASGGGKYRFNQRQLFYVLRPFVMAATGKELTYGNFDGIISTYENEVAEIKGMYRDPRGTVYHPHTGEAIPLGTLAVEAYRRPEWTFNKVLYIEKEGLFEVLKAVRWPERHDCALLTSKGFTTRAVKDLLDLLGDDGEPVTVFCIHDADAAGTMIHQTLQNETRARPSKRRVEIINLGMEPWEALEMGLEVENVDAPAKRKDQPVARYVEEREDGTDWREWLQDHRVELNAMTTPVFLDWLEAKMIGQAGEKVIPPAPVLTNELRERTADHLRQNLTAAVLREARIDDRVRETMAGIPDADGEQLADEVARWHPAHEDRLWRAYVDERARSAAAIATRG